MDKLELIAQILMKKEKIDGKDFKNLMDGTVSMEAFLAEEKRRSREKLEQMAAASSGNAKESEQQ